MNNTQPTTLIILSVRIYRALFMLYPAEYREEYAPHMAQLFRDMCRDAYAQEGIPGMVMWWAATFFDLLVTAFEERRKAKVLLNMSLLKRFAGIFLIGGGISLMLAGYSQLQPGSHFPFRGLYSLSSQFFVPAFLLILLGTIGLALRYARPLGMVGGLTLWVGALGLLTTCIWVVASLIPNGFDQFFAVGLTGFFIYNLCLIIFGAIAMRRNVLPRWNILPIVIGVMTVAVLVPFFSRSSEPYGAQWPLFFWLLLAGLFHAMIGYGVHTKQRLETAPSNA
jgi:hypothetical protein